MRRRTFLSLLVVFSIGLFLANPSSSVAATMTVNTTDDAVDVIPGDGVCETSTGACSLRAAIQEANALAGPDVIELPAGHYVFTLAGVEDSAASGDLDITEDLTINGAGLSSTVVDAASLDRVFHILNASSVAIHGVTITEGNADNTGSSGAGGGVEVLDGASLHLENVLVTANEGTFAGGVSSRSTTSVTIIDSSVTYNFAAQANGGIATSGALVVDSSTVAFNTSTGHGGITISGSALIVNSTVSGNVASEHNIGGIGVFNESGELIEIKNSTITGNTAVTEGGGLWRSSDVMGTPPTIEISNSIISGNQAGAGPDCLGTFTSLDHNLVTDTAGCSFTGTATNDLFGADPMLGPLQSNGGPTDTHALLPGSDAIDAGNPAIPGSGGNACEGADQRSVPRPHGLACDIGSFELDSDFISVEIDIKPRDPSNTVGAGGQVWVAVLSSVDFDGSNIESAGVRFGPGFATPRAVQLRDVNGDKVKDRVFRFSVEEAGLSNGESEACLTGMTVDAVLFEGCDQVTVMGPPA